MICDPDDVVRISREHASRFLGIRINESGLGQVILEKEIPPELLPPDSLADFDPDEPTIPGPYSVSIDLDLPETFKQMNATLENSGFYKMTDWWTRVISRIYMFPRPRIVIRAGRRGGKSSSLARYTCHEALYAGFEAPKGDWLVYPLICQDKRTATDRLESCSQILEALGYTDKNGATKTTAQEIKFPDFRKTIRCVTCTPAAVVGMTCFGSTGDEVTRWRDSNDREIAAEVLKSLAPSMLTMTPKGARLVLISSPMGQKDEHAKAFALGTTEHQLVFYAPTWIANTSPEASKEATRSIEPDYQTWLREYGAIPSALGSHQFFPPDLLREAYLIG
jgi:hypothetical protein